MATEDEIADAYEDFLNYESSDQHLILRLYKLPNIKLEDYEREHFIRLICSNDFTGKLDPEFEDVRKNISTNDSCG